MTIPLDSTAPASAERTATAVEERMSAVLAESTELWNTARPDGVDILGGADLPELARRATHGGKRLRPRIVHWGWVAAGADENAWSSVVDLGAALELLHVFALVHDDVMDGSGLRRGVPSVHATAAQHHNTHGGIGSSQRFGEHIAILVGDLLHSEATLLAARLPQHVRDVWRIMMTELVLGQRRDITGAATGHRNLQQGREIARLKSGSYTVERPLQMGALLGGASPALVECLKRYGWHVGEAFGLRDDLLGTWGDAATTGKSVDEDLKTGKPTVLLALAEQRLAPREAALLTRVGSGTMDVSEVDALRTAMHAAHIPDEVERLIQQEYDSAITALDPAHVHIEAMAGLEQIARQIAWRTS